VGYGALGELHAGGTVAHARDATTPFRFVESLYSMGEWIGPHRLHAPKDLLWYADSRPDEGLYRCRNDYRTADANAGSTL
jgi:CRISPR-associated protein Csy2